MKPDGGEAEVLEGTLERVLFQNPANQWAVARLEPSGGGAAITIVGELVGVAVGTPLVVRGTWETDRRFGRQFRVATYRTKSPDTLIGIERYLGSGFIPGIGPELAKRVVERFGVDTLEIIGRSPERLVEVDGIGPSRARSVAEAWEAQRDVQDVMVFLRGHGISTAYAVRILKRYGKDAIRIVQRNPYRLAIDIWGIGFKIADGIARSLGMEPTSPERMEAGVLHVLGELVEDGHVHAPEADVLSRAALLLSMPQVAVAPALLEEAIERLVADAMVVREELGEGRPCLSLVAMWRSESEGAAALARLVATPGEVWSGDLAPALAVFEEKVGIRLAGQQAQAIEAAMRDKCVVITGGPGVGKTTIVRAIVALMGALHRRVALAAPTGRAAKRLSESTGSPAMTLHRLLEFQPRTQSFARGPHDPLAVDAVIVDEMSMVDTELFRVLVTAVPPEAQLVLVGDVDQLPSVGPGAVLSDIIASGAATVARLTEIFRQAAQSRIVVNAHLVNRGELPDLAPPPGGDPTRSDFYFIEREDPAAARETLLELVTGRIPARFGFDPVRDMQVLTPMHRGELGTMALNRALQARLNPAAEGRAELERGERVLREGDKVMQVKNDYDRDVFNGDVGVIRAIRVGDDGGEGGERGLTVEMADGRTVQYAAADVEQLAHAFAISVHKSQGSEYPAVVIPLLTQHYLMLERNLLYTAITRGKRLVVVVGSRRAVKMAVENGAGRRRWTWLAQRIRAAQGRPPEPGLAAAPGREDQK